MPDPRVHVDFNGVEEDDRIAVLRSHADHPAALEPGTVVRLFDEDGNSAQGRVAEIGERDLVWITVLWDSWSPHAIVLEGDPEQLAPFTMAPGTARHTVWSYQRWAVDLHDRPAHRRQDLATYQVHLVNTGEPATSAD